MRFRLLPVLAVSVFALTACGAEVPEVPDVPDVPEVPSLDGITESALEGADGIKKFLAEQYQLTDIGAVDCPPTPSLSIEKGAVFECSVEVGGEQRTVEVSVLNESGDIQVSEPK